MTNMYVAVHTTFENTNAIFLDSVKCRKYIDKQILRGIGTDGDWKMHTLKEGVPFEAAYLSPIKYNTVE